MKKYYKYCYIAGALFIGILIAYTTYMTPLTGDDWGFAINGMKDNPFNQALHFYNTLSGRFFSEFWVHLAAPNKWIWNIVNPLMFIMIFICIYKLIDVKKYNILIPIIMISVILSVDDNIRMETYSWLTGCIYIISLALSLLYFYLIDKIMFHSYKINKVVALLTNFILFYIGLKMENIAGTMIFAIIILIGYSYLNNKKEMIKYLVINLVCSSISFIILRMSPGAANRVNRDNAAWKELPFIDKIIDGYPQFIDNTFINNNYLIMFISIVVILFIIFSMNKINNIIRSIIVIIMGIGALSVFSFIIPLEYNMFIDPSSIYSMIFWLVYVIAVLVVLCIGLKGYKRNKAIFFFIIAGTTNLIMMYSPIFGARSSIYTVFYLLLVICLLLDEIKLNKIIYISIIFMCLGIIIDRTNEYITKYTLVYKAQQERLEIIQYYIDNPDVKEAWIPRFPIYTLHSVDINPGSTYHLETFKEYYKLPQSADNIIFYAKEADE